MQSDIDKLTIKEINDFHEGMNKLKTIGEWKVYVKEFATKFNLTDMEAIKIANQEQNI